MELVASARLRRAQMRIEAMRPYADRMLELIGGVARAATSVRSLPLLQRREVQTVAIVPITGDRGLAGAFNAQVLRRAFALERELGARARGALLAPGKKGRSTLASGAAGRRGVDRVQRPARVQRRAGDRARARRGVRGRRGRPRAVVYNAFVSPLVQQVTVQEVLPIAGAPARDRRGGAARGRDARRLLLRARAARRSSSGWCPVYVETEIYRALLESAASEQGARMTAMRNASK